MEDRILKVENLEISFKTQFGRVKPVERSIFIYPGETLGIVGESGCGKTDRVFYHPTPRKRHPRRAVTYLFRGQGLGGVFQGGAAEDPWEKDFYDLSGTDDLS